MTEETKANIIKIYNAAKDKKEQIKNLVKMGFGTRAEIINILHDEGLALEFKACGRKAKPQNDKTPEPLEEEIEEPKEEKQEERVLPISQDVRQLLVDQLEEVDGKIRELDEIIQAKQTEKRRLEDLYKHIVETVSH